MLFFSEAVENHMRINVDYISKQDSANPFVNGMQCRMNRVVTTAQNTLCNHKYSGSNLNIKISSYQYRDPHVKDKTVSRPSFL